MALPIITAVRSRRDLKQSVRATAIELAHKASIYGVVRASNKFMAEKCHNSKRTFQRHVVILEKQAHILTKRVVKKLIKVKVQTPNGEREEYRVRNEVNVYTFTIPWEKSPSQKPPIDKMSTTLPPQEREKESSVREDLEKQQKGLRMGLYSPGSDQWRKTEEEIARLEALLGPGEGGNHEQKISLSPP